MKKKSILISVMVVFIAVSVCAMSAYAVNSDKLSSQNMVSKGDISNHLSLTAQSYQDATAEQKAKLEQIEDPYEIPGDYERQVKIIMGELSEDTQRITLEQAIKIYQEVSVAGILNTDVFEGEICRKFNEITGAPDFTGGSGIQRSIYYLNEDGTEVLVVQFGDVTYVNKNTGETIDFEKIDIAAIISQNDHVTE